MESNNYDFKVLSSSQNQPHFQISLEFADGKSVSDAGVGPMGPPGRGCLQFLVTALRSDSFHRVDLEATKINSLISTPGW